MRIRMPDLTKCSKEELIELLRDCPTVRWNVASRKARMKDEFWRPNFEGVDFSGLNLSDTYLRNANLAGANLKETNLERADLKGVNLLNADLRNAILNHVDMRESNLVGADFRQAHLFESNLRASNCMRANLSDANFKKSNLLGARFGGSDAERADFSYADMQSAGFQKVNLRGAILKGANLKETDFQNALLKDVDMKYAMLGNSTRIKGAHLSENKENRITLSGEHEHLGIIRNSPIFVFSTKKAPGYVIKHENWTGDIADFLAHAKIEIGKKSSEYQRIAPLMDMVEAVVAEWPDVKLQPKLRTPTPDTSYLLAEAQRTGQSPADIILDE